MNDSSTIILKKPHTEIESVDKSIAKKNSCTSQEIFTSLITTCLWSLCAVFSVAKAEVTPNATGIYISFTLQEILFMCFSSYLVIKGLYSANLVFILPWMIMNVHSIYYNHYEGILKMTKLLQHLKISAVLPWLAVAFSSLALFFRLLLIGRLIQVYANIWYHKKVERELFNTL